MSVADDFFSDPDECVSVLRIRPGAPDVSFLAIIGAGDQEMLDGHAIAPMRQLAFATGPDVRSGDTVEITGSGDLAVFSGTYQVRDPRQVNDGAESRASLKLIAQP